MSRAVAQAEALLCDVDGCLVPSEPPAFAASAEITNRYLAAQGITRRYDGEELRLATTGKNFRTTATELARAEGVTVDPAELEAWVDEERQAVTAHLREVLEPQENVRSALGRLAARLRLATVSSSASERVDACLEAAHLDAFFSPGDRFSAEDSLPEPRSKPDPAVYLLALKRLGLRGSRAVAVEDSPPGIEAAVAAGIPVIANLAFVAVAERDTRLAELRKAGASGAVCSWGALADLLLAPVPA